MRAEVIGSPIGHSLSPVIHRAAYAALGLDWSYDAVEVTVEGLDRHLAALTDDVAGLSVTAPLKRRLVELARVVSDDAGFLGVGNTWLPGGRVENTDVPGAVNALRERGVASLSSVRVLGGGATAASLLIVVKRLGARSAEIVARNPQTVAGTAAVAERLGLTLCVTTEATEEPVDLLISTIPPQAVDARGVLAHAAAAFDVVYNSWPSPLAEAAADAGKPAVTGIDLLAHQAAEQVRLMTGQPVAVDVLRAAALAAL